MIRVKDGVRLLGMSPQLLLGIMIVDGVMQQYDVDTVITSLSDSKHKAQRSRHYAGQAADIRTSELPAKVDRAVLLRVMQVALGDNYWIIDEGTHLHLEYAPTYIGDI